MFRTLSALVLFVCLAVLYLHGLGSVGVLGPDEPRYASIGREMAASGDWVTPRLWGEKWFEKPALLYWLVGAAYKLGFNDDWAPRVGVAAVSLAFLLFYYFWLRREFGDVPALFGTAVLSTTAGWFAFSQVGVTDVPMSAAFAASMLLAMRWLRSGGRRGLLLSGALLGVAVLGKGLVPLVLAAPLAWVGRKRWRDLFFVGLACVVVALPWYLLCYLHNGWPFIQEFFIEHHFSRFSEDALKHVQPFWFYVPVLIGGLFPWSPLLAFALGRADFGEPRRLLLVLWVVFGFVFFSASTNKLPGYLLPLFPALAALIGIHLAESRNTRWVLAASALLLALAPVASAVLPAALDEGLSKAPVAWAAPVAYLPAFLLALGVWWLSPRHKEAAVLSATAGVLAAIVYLQFSTYPALERSVSVRSEYRTQQPKCVQPYTRRQIEYGYNFYAHKSLPECQQ